MKKLLFLFLLIPFLSPAQEEEFAIGSINDEAAYAQLPQKATQLTRNYTFLPPRASLKSYCPTPSSQGSYGTCVGWSTAYAARTILEAKNNGITNASQNAREAFSPAYVYTHIKSQGDVNCQYGSCIIDAMRLLKASGVSKKTTFFANCASSVPSYAETEASSYKIDDFFTLFSTSASAEKKISSTKMALYQGRPVVISMACYKSFSYAGRCWNGVADKLRGYHAMCVIGYDDTVAGGSFQIMNSWGTTWGEGGFVWVPYSHYANYVNYAYEMYVSKKSNINTVSLSGSMEIRLSSGETMPVTLSYDGNNRVYKVSHSYTSGTRYRIYLNNNEPAYVYVLGADKSGSLDKLFPQASNISPALVYSKNNIAIPDEKWYIEMDNTVGTDYLCLLYCRGEIDINALCARMSSLSGSLPQRLYAALGNTYVDNSEISFSNNSVAFSTKSTKSVLPVIVEIPHR